MYIRIKYVFKNLLKLVINSVFIVRYLMVGKINIL